MSCTCTWEKNGSPKSLKPFFRILAFTDFLVIFIVGVENIGQLG